MRKIPNSKLQDITSRLANGQSTRKVAADLAIGKSTVSRVQNSLKIDLPRQKGGAQKKLSQADVRQMIRTLVKNEAKTAVELTRLMNRDRTDKISVQTVRRALVANGCRARTKKKKPQLVARQRLRRLLWAEKYKNWTVEDWKRVIWSDEKKFNRLCSDGILYYWSIDKNAMADAGIEQTLKFGGGSVMVWGCFTWLGVGGIEQVEGRMDSTQFLAILTRKLLPTLDASSLLPDFPARNDLIFQQDNDPKHTSRVSKKWFSDNSISLLDWPAQSPDLNPIENLWSIVTRRIGRRETPPKSVAELWQVVRDEWSKIEVSACQNLICSMPRRIEAVIKAKGGHTNY